MSFGPSASESAFDDFASFVTLSASDRSDFGLSIIDTAFEDDVVFEKSIAVVQTFAVVQTAGRFGGNLLASDTGAIVEKFSDFVGIADVVLSTV